MTPLLLSTRQKAIAEEMARGRVLRLTLDDTTPRILIFAHRRYMLGDRPVDGRSVDGLMARGFVAPIRRGIFRGWITLELTDAGRRALRGRR